MPLAGERLAMPPTGTGNTSRMYTNIMIAPMPATTLYVTSKAIPLAYRKKVEFTARNVPLILSTSTHYSKFPLDSRITLIRTN